MNTLGRAIGHIIKAAKIPSFSSYEERLHPYIHAVFRDLPGAAVKDVPGNNLLYRVLGAGNGLIALTAHLDKINHYGRDYPDALPVEQQSTFIKGAMDDSAGVGILLAIAELTAHQPMPDVLFCFSEMEESKGLKEHPELIKNYGEGYEAGMGAKRIAQTCLDKQIIPDEVITVDTTPLFEGEPGVALYTKHWEFNELDPSRALINRTAEIEQKLLAIDDKIKLDNNTNDYLHYGQLFNQSREYLVPSIALEPSIFPYHQKGERVFISDISRVLDILINYIGSKI